MTHRRLAPLLSIAAAAVTPGCADLPTAAELAEPQILAVVADPPGMSAPGSADLAVLVAGPDGTIIPDEVTWSLTPGSAGQIEQTADGTWRVVAPDTAGDAATIGVEVAVEVGAAEPLRAIKAVRVGVDIRNPTIAAVVADGEPLPVSEPVRFGAGHTVELDVDTDVAADRAIVSWFTTAGEIDLYRRAPTTLVVRSTAGPAVLYVVYRDGEGGVAWREHPIVVR